MTHIFNRVVVVEEAVEALVESVNSLVAIGDLIDLIDHQGKAAELAEEFTEKILNKQEVQVLKHQLELAENSRSEILTRNKFQMMI